VTTALLAALLAVLSAFLAVNSFASLWWQMHAWRSLETLGGVGFAGRRPESARLLRRQRPERRALPGERLRFSLLVPARHEEQVLAATLRRILASGHDSFEVITIVGHDDPGTTAVAEEVAADAPEGMVSVVVDHSSPKNKPLALNTALPVCRGEIIGVFDAEDEVDPDLLDNVDEVFETTGADVVQGGVQLMNFADSWYSLRNCLEYFYWFRSRLHLHAHHRFIPLGGNTVFVRADVLRSVGGWDSGCLAEDCELGVRLSSLGCRVEVCYDPYLVTREETPDSIPSLVKQRTRWNQGFLQVLRKGIWRQLPLGQRLLARYTLMTPFLQAITGIAVPLGVVVALTTKVPVGVALGSFVPALSTLLGVAFDLAALREFGRLYYVRPRLRHYAAVVLGAFPYQWLLAAAALRAVLRELRGQRGWEKTAHTGAHRGPAAATTTGPLPGREPAIPVLS
jgi:hypothetical protein